MQEMSVAWQMTVDMRLGMFACDPAGFKAEMDDEPGTARPFEMNVQPHNIWTQFLAERIEIAKYSSQDQVDILVSMLHKCLPISVGKPSKIMSCHVAAIGPRFR